MKNLCSWFEIPVIDYDRAKKFYETIMGLEITDQEMEGSKMGMFPFEGYTNGGSITKHEDHKPSADGTLVFLNAGDDLSEALSRVEPAGGKILTPKTKISDEFGYFAVFSDTEGNRVGFFSMQ